MRITEVLSRDDSVRNEVAAIIGDGRPLPKGEAWSVTPEMVEDVIVAGRRRPRARGTRPYTEAVIREFARPVLMIRKNRIELPRSAEMRKRLLPGRLRLEAQLPSVGRIEFTGHPRLRWGGTGWMIADGVIVTNRHVAELFAERRRRGFAFKKNPISDEALSARIDFREEYKQGTTPAFEVQVKKILFIERDAKTVPDVAFLQLEVVDELPPPIPVADDELRDDADVAVVGYPARDPYGSPSEAAARRIFGDIYDVKRFAPGKVLVADAGSWYFTHDATTLGGNSGSVVLDLRTAAACGLHFQGELEKENYAVAPKSLVNYIGRIRLRSRVAVPRAVHDAAPDAVEERKPADYDERAGYDPRFLGNGTRVNLPKKKVRPRDVLTFGTGSRRTSELKYTHFSVAMSRKRKLCLWSAVNIDGAQSKKRRRTGWKIDPRIKRSDQLVGDEGDDDVYGNPPRFARGHMTRREDPIWGTPTEADLGNEDSMHLTNAVPQIQPFNAGIWNGLEDYALDHARDDSMRISVMTGPIMTDEDRTLFGVQVPTDFWKVIAFIHDETGELCATGYTMSQRTFLDPEEFVYGEYETSQVPIKLIESRTGLTFGSLSRRDPLAGAHPEAATMPLSDFNEIQFVPDE